MVVEGSDGNSHKVERENGNSHKAGRIDILRVEYKYCNGHKVPFNGCKRRTEKANFCLFAANGN
jgi:hypothetical protein